MDRQQASIRSYFSKDEGARSQDPDVSIVKVVPPKKAQQWVSSSFEGFDEDFSLGSQSGQRMQSQSLVPGALQTGVAAGRKRGWEEVSSAATRLSHRLPSRHAPHSRHRQRQPASGQLWLDKHQPQSKADLAVHKKKVEELESTLTQMLDASQKAGQGGRVLLLTGPAGSGKTAAVRVLAGHLGALLQEWSNPLQTGSTPSSLQPPSREDVSRVEGGQFDSQARQFENFLLRATKYQALPLAGSTACSRKVILVEDFPNVFLRDPAMFHQLVRKYQVTGHCPLVFVVSDASSGDSVQRLLFPRDLQEQAGLLSISFNPVAPTMMVKLLSRIAAQEATQAGESPPSPSVTEAIALASAGDIRSAINTLQFACRQDTADLGGPRGQGRRAGAGPRLKYGSHRSTSSGQEEATAESKSATIGARDATCFLFHAIGKVLYCKRGDPKECPDHPHMPPHLTHLDRDPLLLNPEEVVERSHAGADYFASFLHQNYLDFYRELEDAVQASHYLSDADFFTADWASRGVMGDYAASIATRGVVFCNSLAARHGATRPNLGWRPLHKSQWFSVSRQAKENCSNAQTLFRSCHWEPRVLWTELVPFLNLTTVPLHDPGQIAFVQEMATFPRGDNHARAGLERLSETDVPAGSIPEEEELPLHPSASNAASGKEKNEDNCEELSDSQSQVQQTPGKDGDEDVIIEDYDDDCPT